MASAKRLALHRLLLQKQLLLLANIARKPAGDIVRRAVLNDNSLEPSPLTGARRVGRPRRQWKEEVYKVALEMAGSKQELERLTARSPEAKACFEALVKAPV